MAAIFLKSLIFFLFFLCTLVLDFYATVILESRNDYLPYPTLEYEKLLQVREFRMGVNMWIVFLVIIKF